MGYIEVLSVEEPVEEPVEPYWIIALPEIIVTYNEELSMSTFAINLNDKDIKPTVEVIGSTLRENV